MAQKKKSAARRPKKRKTGKRFRFQLSLGGAAGVAVVAFCLFLWMFLLGIWAGQTILLPSAADSRSKASRSSSDSASPVKILRPDGKKNPVAPKSGLLQRKTAAPTVAIALFLHDNRQGA